MFHFWNSSILCFYCVAILFIVAMKKVLEGQEGRQGLYPCTSTKAETTEKEPCHNKSPRFNQVWHWGKSCWMENKAVKCLLLRRPENLGYINQGSHFGSHAKGVISLDWFLAFDITIAVLPGVPTKLSRFFCLFFRWFWWHKQCISR